MVVAATTIFCHGCHNHDKRNQQAIVPAATPDPEATAISSTGRTPRGLRTRAGPSAGAGEAGDSCAAQPGHGSAQFVYLTGEFRDPGSVERALVRRFPGLLDPRAGPGAVA